MPEPTDPWGVGSRAITRADVERLKERAKAEYTHHFIPHRHLVASTATPGWNNCAACGQPLWIERVNGRPAIGTPPAVEALGMGRLLARAYGLEEGDDDDTDPIGAGRSDTAAGD